MLLRHGTFADKEKNLMKGNKDLQFCMNLLGSMLNRNELEPEQQRTLDGARNVLKRLWRKADPSREEIYHAVRIVAEAILNTLNSD